MTALRTPNFRRLWLAGLVSDTGDWLLLASLPIVVYQFTGSTLGTAAAFLVELIPPVLLAPLVGRIADRWDRRRTLMIVSLLQAIALTPLLFVHDRSDLAIVYAVIAVQAALASVFDPTKNALLPTLVDDDQLVSANSLVGLNQNIGRLIGAPIGGVLIAVGGGLSGVVAVDAVTFLVAMGLIGRLTTVPANEPTTNAATPDVARPAQSWRAVLSGRVIRGALATLFLASVAQGLFVVLFVVFVARSLHGDPTEIGTLRGVQAIGAIAGGLLLAIAGRIAPSRLTAISAIAFGLLDLAIWNAPQVTTAVPVYVVLFIAAGVPGVAMVTGLLSVVQRATPDDRRGTVFAAFGVAASAGQAVGMIAGGLLGDRVGVVAVLNGQGVLYLLAGLVAARWLTARTVPADIRAAPGGPDGSLAANQATNQAA
jgi:MFS family permease